MLMALRFEPSRFFLKGKVTQKQTSYKHKHTVREIANKMQSKGYRITTQRFAQQNKFSPRKNQLFPPVRG